MTRLIVVALIAALLGLFAQPADAQMAPGRLAAKVCAMLYYPYSGDNDDDPRFIAMIEQGIAGNEFVKPIRESAHYTRVVPMNVPEAVSAAKSLWTANFSRFSERTADGKTVLNTLYHDQIWECMFTHSIKAPQAYLDTQYTTPAERTEFEGQWAQGLRDAERYRERVAASKALDEADKHLSMCFQAGNPLRNGGNLEMIRSFADLRLACATLRVEAIKVAEEADLPKRAQEYRNMRFPWE